MIRAMEGRSKVDWLKILGVGGLTAIAVALATGLVSPAFAADAPPMTINKGDNTWMLVSTVIVWMMSLPGLFLFYGGLARAKNMGSVITQVMAIVCIVCIVWFLYGYSIAFTTGPEGFNQFFGGFSKVFLKGVVPGSMAESFSVGVAIDELVFMCFQMTFAAITTALVIGAFVERVKFGTILVFAVLWSTFVYFPIAHMVWFWPGPTAVAVDPSIISGDALAKNAGLIWGFGALDFAGGTVVHINAGISGLVGCLMVGKRMGYGSEPMPPHSLTLSATGAGLLWVGWFGFNGGSNLEANGYAALAVANTFIATAAAGISWLLVEWVFKGKPSLLGLVSGVIAGLVAVTPPAGFAGPMGALVLGLIVSPVCFFFVTVVKNLLKYDDSLDVFGIHAVGGILGALATGILVDPSLGGAGIVDYTTCAADGDLSTCDAYAAYTQMGQLMIQAKAVGVSVLWSGIGSLIIFTVLKIIFGLRVSEDKEQEGLDISDHGERAYHY